MLTHMPTFVTTRQRKCYKPVINHCYVLMLMFIYLIRLDNIGPRILKLSANVLAPSLLFIVNKSLITGKFPCSWK